MYLVIRYNEREVEIVDEFIHEDEARYYWRKWKRQSHDGWLFYNTLTPTRCLSGDGRLTNHGVRLIHRLFR